MTKPWILFKSKIVHYDMQKKLWTWLINLPNFIQTISTIIITSLLIPKKNLFWNVTKNYNSLKIVHPPSTLPRLLILFPRLLRPPSIFLLALRKVMVAWLAVLNDILVFILGACMSLLLSLRSKGGGSLMASSSWSGFKGRLNPIHSYQKIGKMFSNSSKLILLKETYYHNLIVKSIWPMAFVWYNNNILATPVYFHGIFWKSNIQTQSVCLYCT